MDDRDVPRYAPHAPVPRPHPDDLQVCRCGQVLVKCDEYAYLLAQQEQTGSNLGEDAAARPAPHRYGDLDGPRNGGRHDDGKAGS